MKNYVHIVVVITIIVNKVITVDHSILTSVLEVVCTAAEQRQDLRTHPVQCHYGQDCGKEHNYHSVINALSTQSIEWEKRLHT